MPQSKLISIVLYGKTYQVRCPVGEETALRASVTLLNEKISKTTRNTGLNAREDIIMMTALNLCNELLEQQFEQESIEEDQQEALHNTQAAAMLHSMKKRGNNKI